eukprot:gene8585-6179_t
MTEEELGQIMKEMEELAANETEEEPSDAQPPIEEVAEPASRQSPPSWSAPGAANTQAKQSSSEVMRDKLKTKKKRQLKRKATKRNESPPATTAGGAYYGGDIDREKRDAFHHQQQQRQTQKQSSRSRSSARRSKMASMSNSRFQELEDRLSENTRINVAYAEQQLAERKEADQLRRARYVVPRHLAAPVERIVATYDDVRADLYSVLGVPRSADDFALKRQYRALALQVHPDKNPHPDAKAAFDAIQDAYDVLANPSKRCDYDKELMKMARVRSLTPRKLRKMVQEGYNNVVSQWLLAWHQFRRGEPVDELTLLKHRLHEKLTELQHFGEHLRLLPTAADRVRLVNEAWARHRWALLVVALLLPAFA